MSGREVPITVPSDRVAFFVHHDAILDREPQVAAVRFLSAILVDYLHIGSDAHFFVEDRSPDRAPRSDHEVMSRWI